MLAATSADRTPRCPTDRPAPRRARPRPPRAAHLGPCATSTPRPTAAQLARDLDRAEADGEGLRRHPRRQAGRPCRGRAGRRHRRAMSASRRSLGRVMSYAQLLFAGDSNDPAIGRFYQSMNERVTAISSRPDLLHPRAEPAGRRGAGGRSSATRRSPAGGRGCATCACSARTSFPTSWRSCCTRRRSPGAAAWSRLFDETVAALRVPRGRRGTHRQRRAQPALRRDRARARGGGARDRRRVRRATSGCSR